MAYALINPTNGLVLAVTDAVGVSQAVPKAMPVQLGWSWTEAAGFCEPQPVGRPWFWKSLDGTPTQAFCVGDDYAMPPGVNVTIVEAGHVSVETPSGYVRVHPGDWIVRARLDSSGETLAVLGLAVGWPVRVVAVAEAGRLA